MKETINSISVKPVWLYGGASTGMGDQGSPADRGLQLRWRGGERSHGGRASGQSRRRNNISLTDPKTHDCGSRRVNWFGRSRRRLGRRSASAGRPTERGTRYGCSGRRRRAGRGGVRCGGAGCGGAGRSGYGGRLGSRLRTGPGCGRRRGGFGHRTVNDPD